MLGVFCVCFLVEEKMTHTTRPKQEKRERERKDKKTKLFFLSFLFYTLQQFFQVQHVRLQLGDELVELVDVSV